MTRRQRIALLIEKRRVFSRVARFRNGRTYHYRIRHYRTERAEAYSMLATFGEMAWEDSEGRLVRLADSVRSE